MTYDELPRWLRTWIVVALVLVVSGVLACMALGVLTELDSRNAP